MSSDDMAAYSALVSLSNLLNQILNPERNYFSCEKLQFQSLDHKLSFLQTFLRDNSRNNTEAFHNLEAKIREAAWEAENIIESHVYSHIVKHDPINHGRYKNFSEAVDSLIAEMDLIIETMNNETVVGARVSSFPFGGSSSRSSTSSGKNTKVVGRDAELEEIINRLTRQQSGLQLLPIIGMGGAGKTSLARTVFEDPIIKKHFPTRAWVTVSQNYEVVEILQRLIRDVSVLASNEERKDEDCAKGILSKTLKTCKRYLIVMDDVWDNHVWDSVKGGFPDDKKGSWILFTSRLEEVAEYVNPNGPRHQISLLGGDASWNLFCHTVFENGCCPPELEASGRKIVQRCDGLPLAIVVISGLLSKEEKTRDFWDRVAENVSSFANQNYEQLSQVFLLSYNYLPQHLKACFLYMGCFREDQTVRVSRLIRLWIAEGFIESDPDGSKSLEEIGEEYLEDLISRNLILAKKQRSDRRRTKTCSIHDVLREICLKIGQKEKFLCVIDKSNNLDNEVDANSNSRLVTHGHGYVDSLGISRISVRCLFYARSFLCSGELNCFPSFKLLRVLDVEDTTLTPEMESIVHLANLKYLAFWLGSSPIPSSISVLWNLQTLIVYQETTTHPIQIPFGIWEMPQLRHVQLKPPALLPDPSADKSLVLRNLQTFSYVQNLKCSMEVTERIPNLKKLALYYVRDPLVFDISHFHLHNLSHFPKLEILRISCDFPPLIPSDFPHLTNVESLLTFPETLRKLTLQEIMISWEDMTIIGSLPNLKVLKLKSDSCTGKVWEPVEGQFSRLEFLLLHYLDLEEWKAEDIHFPSLRHLIIERCYWLREIPSSIADIPTLEIIELIYCNPYAENSLKLIESEQRDSGNDLLQVLIFYKDDDRTDSDSELEDPVGKLVCDSHYRKNSRVEEFWY